MSDRKRTARTIQAIHVEWAERMRTGSMTNSSIDRDTYTSISDEQTLRDITSDPGNLYHLFVNIL